MTSDEILGKIRKQVKAWMPEHDGDEHTEGERLAFRSVLHLLDEMEETNHLIDANKMVGEEKGQELNTFVWHKATETPTPDTEVLAEVKGFEHNRFAVLQWNKEGWWQHIPRMNDIMPSDGWVGTQGLFIIRWTYII